MDMKFGKLGKTLEEVIEKAEPVVDTILKAQDDIDYITFCNQFEGALKTNITRADFEQNAQHIQSTMGKLKDKQFMTTLSRDGLIALVYKCRFSGSKDDFMVTITFNDKSKPLKATGIWIS